MSAFNRLFDASRFAVAASLVAWSFSSVAVGAVMSFTDYATWSGQEGVTVLGTESFESFEGFYTTATGTVGGVAWTANATGGLFAGNVVGSQAMSTDIASPMTFSYIFAVGLTGVGGKILATNEGFVFLPGDMSVVVNLADSTQQAFTRTIDSPTDFWGFHSIGTPISSITIMSGAGYPQTAFPTIDNMVVAVPEPSTWGMGAVGIACAMGAALRRGRRNG